VLEESDMQSFINTTGKLFMNRQVFVPLRQLSAYNAANSIRAFSSTTKFQARKDTMDKDSLKPEGNEYSKSASDAEAATTGTAFDPSKTRPEEELNSAEAEKGVCRHYLHHVFYPN